MPINEKSLSLKISELNEIPNYMCTDNKLYEGILFHLIQNSIKHNKKAGSISIDLSYHELDIPDGYDFEILLP